MYYRGEATMHANKRLLSLHGAVKLDMEGSIPSPNWLNYDKEDEVDQIVIMTEGQKTVNGKEPVTGIHYSPVLGDYYVTFFGQKGGKKDFTVFKSEGIFMYDQKNTEYLVGDSLKISGQNYEGDLFGYNEKKEVVRVQGLIDVFGHPEEGKDENGDKIENVEHPVEATISAEGDMYLLDSTFFINGLTFLTYDYDLKALDAMGADLEQMAALYGMEQAYHFNDTLAYEIADIAGEKAAQEFRENPTLPLPKVVKQFADGVVLTDVHLVWDKNHKAWYSKGRFGVGSVGKHQVNSMVTGYLEIRKGKGFNYSVNLYIELNDRVWYYLTFEQNKLLTVSSNAEYNEIITKKNTRAKNEAVGNYFFDLAPSSSKARFFKRFISNYLNGEGLDDLEIQPVDVLEEGSGELDEEEESVGEEEMEEEEILDESEEELEDIELTDEEEDEFFEEMQDEVPADEPVEDEMQDEEVDENHADQGDFYEPVEEEEAPKKKKKKKKKKNE